MVSSVQEGFGNILATSGSLTTNNSQLTKKEIEPEAGLYYFYARWYDPVVVRFITRDFIRTCNLYTYVENNPTNFVDPTGNQMTIFPIAIGNCLAMAIVIGNPIRDKYLGGDIWNNFMRHCVWSCSLGRIAGGTCATFAGWLKERLPGDVRDPADEAANHAG